MAKSAASRIASLALRVAIIVPLLVSLIVLCTNTNTTTATRGDYDYAEQDSGFQDVIAYRYMLSWTVIGTVYALLQLTFTIYNVVGKNDGNLLLDFYGDKVMSYVLATGAASEVGVTKDMEELFNKLGIKLRDKFYAMSYASASLLHGFVYTAVLSMLSSYALIPKTSQVPDIKTKDTSLVDTEK